MTHPPINMLNVSAYGVNFSALTKGIASTKVADVALFQRKKQLAYAAYK